MAIFEGSFSDKKLKDFWYKKRTRGLPVENTDKLKAILNYINTMKNPPKRDMQGQLFRLHEHSGSEQGTYSLSVNGNMRVLFEFDEDADPVNIRITDPH